MADTTQFKDPTLLGTSLEELSTFQQDQLTYLYEMEPSSDNMFWCGNFHDHNKPEEQDATTNSRYFSNAQFRIRSVKFNFPTLSFEQDPNTHTMLLKDVEITKEVSVGFIDDVYRSVMKYHLDWFARWYNRALDCFRVGADGKFKGLDLILYHFIDGNEASMSPLNLKPTIQPVLRIKLRGLAPQALGDFSVDYSSTGNEKTREYSYAVNHIELDYWQEIVGSEWKKKMGNNDDKKQGVWRPLDVGVQAASVENAEQDRILRSVTQAIASEGYIV